MNITNENAVMIFRREYNGNVYYSVGLSKKNQDNTYTNGYMPCQFKKGVLIEDKTKIYIRKAWLSFYLKDKETKPYIFINEFELVGETIEKAKEEIKEVDPFTQFANEVELTDDDLPF